MDSVLGGDGSSGELLRTYLGCGLWKLPSRVPSWDGIT
jgi:hypothetical protein